MESFIRDTRVALRVLARNSVYAAVVIVILGLGIGANTTVFAIVNRVLLRPLPYLDSERLVQVWGIEEGQRKRLSEADYLALKTQTGGFEHLALYQVWDSTLSDSQDSSSLRAAFVSTNLFEALGVQPIMGRLFVPEDVEPDAELPVILSFGLWQRRYAASENALGSKVVIDRRPGRIVGVAPPQMSFPDDATELWLSLGASDSQHQADKMVLGRLRRGVSREQAQSEVNLIASRLAGRSKYTGGLAVVPLRDPASEAVRPVIALLWLAVGLVLIITCANVAHLFFVHITSREVEISIRKSLGASRLVLLRQLLTEAVLLGLAGGLLGLGFTYGILQLFRGFSPLAIPGITEIRVESPVLIFTLVLSVLTGVVFGLLPAVRLTAVNLSDCPIRTPGGMASGIKSPGQFRIGGLMTILQLALALALLIASAVTLKSLFWLSRVDLGYHPKNVLALWISLDDATYSGGRDTVLFFRRIVELLKELPGIQEAGLSANGLYTGRLTATLTADQGALLAVGHPLEVEMRVVSHTFFRALGIPMLRGRFFAEGVLSTDLVDEVVVDETLARRLSGERDPIGQRINLTGWGKRTQLKIVGIVSGIRDIALESEPSPTVYVSYHSAPSNSMAVFVRTNTDPLGLAAAVRAKIRAVDPHQAAAGITTLEHMVSEKLTAPRLRALLLGAVAALSLILALLGVYGVVSYVVGRRCREFGIRMALGAAPSVISKMVLRQAAGLTMIGAAMGTLGGWLYARLLGSMVYGIHPFDWEILPPVLLLFLGATLLASYFPARRASRLELMAVLRED